MVSRDVTRSGYIFKACSGCSVENGLGVRGKAGHQQKSNDSGPGEREKQPASAAGGSEPDRSGGEQVNEPGYLTA